MGARSSPMAATPATPRSRTSVEICSTPCFIRSVAAAEPRFTVLRRASPGAPPGGASLSTKASGARDQATSSAAACLQKARERAAGQVHFAFTARALSPKTSDTR